MRESPKTLPQLKGPSKEQPPTNGPSEDPKPAGNLTVTLPTGQAPSKTPPTRESSKTLQQLRSPSKDQPATEVQAGDRQTAEGPTTNQQAEKAPENPPASESLSNGEYPAGGLTTDLSQGEILKDPTESSSQDQSTAERSSEDHTVESLPFTKPAAKASPSSGELSGKTPFRHLPRIL